jgi:hypothetical protein
MKCKVCGNEVIEVFLDTYVNIYAQSGYCSKRCYEKIRESYLDKTIKDPRDPDN